MNWQPIETAPKDGTPILLWWDGDFAPVAHWADDKWQFHMADLPFANIFFQYTPTHWMPLPEPSK